MSDAGVHNDNLEVSAARILQGGTWKHQRAVCIMPAGKSIPFKVAAAMRGLMVPPNQAFAFIGAEGMEVGEAYSRTIEHVLADPVLSTWEYLLFVEHDNTRPPGRLHQADQADGGPPRAFGHKWDLLDER